MVITPGAQARPAPSPGSPQVSATTEHVVVLGIDGLLFDKIAPAAAPNLDALIATGYRSKTTLYAPPLSPTLSGPGWATNLTGVWPDKHKVLDNTWPSSNLAQYPDFLTRLEQFNSSLSTYAAVTWAPLLDGSAGPAPITSAVDTRYVSTGDADTAANAVSRLRGQGPNATFLHFDDVDHAGHTCGAAGACYQKAIEDTDVRIGQVVAAVKARATYPTEKWTFIVTADHGHTDAGGHGGNTPPERSSFVIESGAHGTPGVPAIAPKNVDTAAEVLSIFGAPRPSVLDGRPYATASSDPFDKQVSSLKARQDETGIPTSVLGWTKSFPSGWSVDNTGLGTGGVAEWSGWSLTTDDFWTRAEPGQSREANVRARGVFAVADSDEWSDKTHTGTYNTKMSTPAYTGISGKATATLRFGSHYRKEGNEVAAVSVSFNGGAPKEVLRYSGDVVAKNEQVSVPIPAGATTVRFTWSLTNGDNDWYWAVDAPSVSAG
ncbi:nucleotide pyrophosphatase [Luteipulveratus mongoliensis]|uniref:Nucleotide pyrophosphatase n=1 Tax=Luteipulveratus mongoliensis TaxID=571913 RepID=A0A0K1JRJ2_9MICO|nr:nucleotide pyrophosphatase [Luteipulveratus mongoliensis]